VAYSSRDTFRSPVLGRDRIRELQEQEQVSYLKVINQAIKWCDLRLTINQVNVNSSDEHWLLASLLISTPDFSPHPGQSRQCYILVKDQIKGRKTCV
jgi:hypothetical protein